MPNRVFVGTTLVLLCLTAIISAPLIAGQEEGVGRLRVAGVKYPRQVAPGGEVQLQLDVEYAVHGGVNVSVKSSIFEGPLAKLGAELWHSDPVVVELGGEKIWSATLKAPAGETLWVLTVIAYYFDEGTWTFFNDTHHGPGFGEVSIKIAPTAKLEINLGAAQIPVAVDNSTKITSPSGKVTFELPVSAVHEVVVPPEVDLKNSTRLVFGGWRDNTNTTHRTVLLDGDMTLAAGYRTQYLLKVDSVVPTYNYAKWIDAGSNVTLLADAFVPIAGLLQTLGLHYVFKGWTGDAKSGSPKITFVMTAPRNLTASYNADYTPLVIPTIIAVGIVGAIVLSLIARRHRGKQFGAGPPVEGEEEAEVASEKKTCRNCGEEVEEGWSHCVRCGEPLASSEPVQS